jgi:hypothetical protein
MVSTRLYQENVSPSDRLVSNGTSAAPTSSSRSIRASNSPSAKNGVTQERRAGEPDAHKLLAQLDVDLVHGALSDGIKHPE